MDGDAIVAAFGMTLGMDVFKDVLPKFGQRVKVYQCLKEAVEQAMFKEVSKVNV